MVDAYRFVLAVAVALGGAVAVVLVGAAVGAGMAIARAWRRATGDVLVELGGIDVEAALREVADYERGYRLYEPCACGGWREIVEREEVAL